MSNPILLRLLGPEYEAAAARTHRLYMAERAATLEGLPGGSEAIPVQLYHALPWLFADLFPSVSDDDLQRVAAAGILYFEHVLLLDRAVDGDAHAHPARLVASSFLHERALTLLFPALPADTPAWGHLARYGRQYARAVFAERAMAREGAAAFPWELFEKVARGKSAILKASPAMVACIAGEPGRVGEMEEVVDLFSVGVQVQDDLEDWRDDFRAGRASHVVAAALARAEPGEDGRPAEEDVGHALFYGGVAEEALERGIASVEASAARAREAGAGRWARLAEFYAAHLRKVAGGFRNLRERGMAVASGVGRDHLHAALEKLARGLEEEHRKGYPEAEHAMIFARADGFTGADDRHAATVFQRAVLGWLYAEMERAGRAPADGVLDENLAALREMRPRGERGGWSYFPTLPELPPDSDDLAQVIHAHAARPDGAWDALFAAPVDLVLAHHRHPTGAVDTWIVDPEGDPERGARYRDAVARHWGRGVDPEVVANFFAALHAWDAERFGDLARAGAEYVAGAQDADGAWKSTWYVGPWYGTFAAARLLRRVDPAHPALERARGLLRERQRPDGGWGLNGHSDALSTALALLAWTEAADPADAGARRVTEAAARHLVLVQKDGGLWPRRDFIRMEVGRATPGAPVREITYGSATMTAAFAGAALVAAGRMLEGA